MSQLNKNKYSTEQVMMILSAIAYVPFYSIAQLQESIMDAEALGQAYDAIWWAGEDAHVAFVVKHRLTEEYTIVFRGPVFRFGLSFLFDIYENMEIGRQVKLPYSQLGNAKIAGGIPGIIQQINNLQYNGRSLAQIIDHFPGGSRVNITGHSLGGSIASVYAVMMACNNLNALDINPYTYGAPTAGNKSFADLFSGYTGHCLFSQPGRCVNNRDLIPYAWHDLLGIPAIDYQNTKCPLDFTLCLDNIARMIIISRAAYLQPSLKLQLEGKKESNAGFYEEAMFQHQPDTYIALMGLKPIPHAAYSFVKQKDEALTDHAELI